MWTTEDPNGVAHRCGYLPWLAVARLDDLARAFRRAEAAVPEAERTAEAKIRKARQDRDVARRALAAGIVEEWRAGTTQADIARRTGYSREHIRRILREHGIQAGE